MTGDEEVIQNLVKEIDLLKNRLIDQNISTQFWKDLFYEAKELIQDYKKLLHIKEHSDER